VVETIIKIEIEGNEPLIEFLKDHGRIFTNVAWMACNFSRDGVIGDCCNAELSELITNHLVEFLKFDQEQSNQGDSDLYDNMEIFFKPLLLIHFPLN
jgi:hypothetical protein